MLRFPNAKINIGLFITEKRADGYHNLETVFYPVAVKDALEIIASEKAQVHLSGLAVAGASDNNLVWKAYQMLLKDFPELVKPLDIYLHKAIPMGAGLGGGSADGAFMLSMLNDFFNLNISSEKLASHALQLGSDCPFFIRNKPVFAKGRGEIMETVPLNLEGYSIQLICPKIHISTANAFKGIIPQPSSFHLHEIAMLDINDWKNHISNDFEKTLFPHYPALQQIKDQLYEQGAIYASLSGTGATVYGIFEKGSKAELQLDTAFDTFLYH
jgi:4-diphosphocytidyl-2-C-methyl-D-erythritol kinase